MARVKGPLLSIEAHGHLGSRLLFRSGKKAAHAYLPADPTTINQRPATPAQAAVRNAYRDLLNGWQSLSETDRHLWRALALTEPRAVNGWNLYLKWQGHLPAGYGDPGGGGEEEPGDPGSAYLSLLLQFQGEVDSSTFIDSSPFHHAITQVSGVSLIDTNPAFPETPTSASFYIWPSKRLLVPAHPCFDLPGDFTVMARWRSDSSPSMVLFASESLTGGTWFAEILYWGSSYLMFGAYGSMNVMFWGPLSITPYEWHEIMFTRCNGLNVCLVDGQKVSLAYGNDLNSTPWISDPVCNRIGGVDGDTYSLNAQLAEFAIFNGFALHTDTYTPLTRLRQI